jgi:hypothetical protein
MEDQIRKMPDEQILRMLTIDSAQYRPEALAIAEDEARRRGLDLQTPLTDSGGEHGKFGEAFKSAFEAAKAATGPARFMAAGKPVVCSHCGADLFDEKPALLNTRLRTFFKLDWLDPGATVLVCESCSSIRWFVRAPDRM